MPSILDSLVQNKMFGIPILYVIVGLVFIFILLYLKFRKPPKEELKRKDIFKIVKTQCQKLFAITDENIGRSRTLNRGSVVIGHIMKMIQYNWYESIDKEDITKPEIMQQLGLNIKDKDELEKIKNQIVKSDEKKIKITKPFYAFKVCNKSILGKLKAIVGIGIKYYFVDKELITFNPFEVVINPLAQYVNYVDVVVFSQSGIDIINNFAFKENLENVLEELANVLPKQTFLEIKQSESKLQYDILDSIGRERRKEMIEQIKRS